MLLRAASGSGAGTVSNELAQKGIDVVCLEAGLRMTLADIVNNPAFTIIQRSGSTSAIQVHPLNLAVMSIGVLTTSTGCRRTRDGGDLVFLTSIEPITVLRSIQCCNCIVQGFHHRRVVSSSRQDVVNNVGVNVVRNSIVRKQQSRHPRQFVGIAIGRLRPCGTGLQLQHSVL